MLASSCQVLSSKSGLLRVEAYERLPPLDPGEFASPVGDTDNVTDCGDRAETSYGWVWGREHRSKWSSALRSMRCRIGRLGRLCSGLCSRSCLSGKTPTEARVSADPKRNSSADGDSDLFGMATKCCPAPLDSKQARVKSTTSPLHGEVHLFADGMPGLDADEGRWPARPRRK